MIERYGKDINMRNIRSFEDEMRYNQRAKIAADTYFGGRGSKCGSVCRICGSEDNLLYFEAYGGYLYYECRHCGSLFLDNLPKLDEMYRDDNVTNTKSYIDETIFEERVKQLQAPKVDFVLEVCKQNNIVSTTWVDVGAGGGQLLAAVQNKNINVYGIESDKAEIEFMRNKGFSVIERFLEPDSDDKEIEKILKVADVVSFMMVLEHVKSPAEILNYIYDKMRPGAVFVLEVPRHPSVASFANLVYRDIAYRHITVPVHLQIFTEKSICLLFENKFRIIGKWGYGEGFSDLMNFPLFSNEATYDKNLYEMIMAHNNDVQRLFDSAGLSDMMMFVAVRE